MTSCCTNIKYKKGSAKDFGYNENNNDKWNEKKISSNVCNESITVGLDSLFNEHDEFISFECPKCNKKRDIIVSCFYEKNYNLQYQINFRLVSPYTILNQKWFKANIQIDIAKIRKEYFEIYLSILFYFHQAGLIFDFLFPKEIEENELIIESLGEKQPPENEKEEKEVRKINTTDYSTLDLGAQNVGFFEPIKKDEEFFAHKSNKFKKTLSTMTCAEFQSHLEDKK